MFYVRVIIAREKTLLLDLASYERSKEIHRKENIRFFIADS